MTSFSSLRLTRDRQPAKPKVIDVDEFSEKRFRRKSWKRKVKKTLKKSLTLRLSSSKGEDGMDMGSVRSRSSSWTWGESTMPGMMSSSSLSVSSMSSYASSTFSQEATALDETPIGTITTTSASSNEAAFGLPHSQQVVNGLLVIGVVNSILRSQRAWRIAMGLERQCAPTPLPTDLVMEIVLFRWPLKVLISPQPEPSVDPATHQGVEEPEETALVGAPSKAVVVQKEEDDKDEQSEALKKQLTNLNTVTELLSKQLVESTLASKRESTQHKKKALGYQQMIAQMKAQHHAECEALVNDKKYLQEELRRHKIEKIPPTVGPSEETKRVLRKLQRSNSFTSSFVAQVQACLKSTSAANTSTRASFSMASNMILQQKLLPAMLGALATANREANAKQQAAK